MLSQLLNTLLNDFIELQDVLISERSENWLPGINSIIKDISYAIENTSSADYFITSARDTYSSINGGYGSFSDFFIWREEFEERKKLNVEFDKFKKKINHDFNAIFEFYSK